MQQDARSQSTALEGTYRPGQWDTCFNVAIVCPGCLTRIRRCTSGIFSCHCKDVLWRRHPLATGPDVPWQVLFLDDIAVC